jgi:hypothetical protein
MNPKRSHPFSQYAHETLSELFGQLHTLELEVGIDLRLAVKLPSVVLVSNETGQSTFLLALALAPPSVPAGEASWSCCITFSGGESTATLPCQSSSTTSAVRRGVRFLVSGQSMTCHQYSTIQKEREELT